MTANQSRKTRACDTGKVREENYLSRKDPERELTDSPEGMEFLEEIAVEATKALLAGDDDLFYEILDPLEEWSDWRSTHPVKEDLGGGK